MTPIAVRLPLATLVLAAGSAAYAGPAPSSASGEPRARPPAPGALVGKPAPDFALRDLEGKVWRLSALRGGKIAVIQFASTSCQCGQSGLIALDALRRCFERRGVQALAIGFEAAPLVPPAEFLQDTGLAVTFLADPALRTARAYGVAQPPCVVLVDRLGIVRWTCDAFLDDVLEQTSPVVASLLAADEAWNADSTYGRLYASGAATRASGAVAVVERCTPLPGMSPGVALTLRQGSRSWRVHLGPAWYVEAQPLRLAPGDRVTVMGASVRLNAKQVVLAAEIRRGKDRLMLRDAAGRPRWQPPAAPARGKSAHRDD